MSSVENPNPDDNPNVQVDAAIPISENQYHQFQTTVIENPNTQLDSSNMDSDPSNPNSMLLFYLWIKNLITKIINSIAFLMPNSLLLLTLTSKI